MQRNDVNLVNIKRSCWMYATNTTSVLVQMISLCPPQARMTLQFSVWQPLVYCFVD